VALNASTAEILIVEDDEVIMGTLAYNLSRQGFSISQATTGAEALRLARKLRPDLILLDLMLPGEESGIAVCKRIRELDAEVVIVMVTAKDAEDDKVRGFEAGADDYVTKPFGMKELVARINANLKRSEAGGGVRSWRPETSSSTPRTSRPASRENPWSCASRSSSFWRRSPPLWGS
jgi:DNA-binding response OmpR family regulator